MDANEYRAQIDRILTRVRVRKPSDATDYAAHYTYSSVPRLMLDGNPASNCMRQYDGDYMNDPQEGRYLIDVMIRCAKGCTHPQRERFVASLFELQETRLLYSAYKKCTFLSCWTRSTVKPGQEHSADSLNHWRFYGENAAGSAIFVPTAHLVDYFGGALYEVSYGLELRGGGARASNRPEKSFEDAFTARINSLRTGPSHSSVDFQKLIVDTHPVLFLFKSSDYSSERELRSVVHRDNYGPAQGVQFDQREPPRKAFVSGGPGMICDGSLIFYGPKADEKLAIEVLGHAESQNVRLSAFMSNKPYR